MIQKDQTETAPEQKSQDASRVFMAPTKRKKFRPAVNLDLNLALTLHRKSGAKSQHKLVELI